MKTATLRLLNRHVRTRAYDSANRFRDNAPRAHFRAYCIAYALAGQCYPGGLTEAEVATLRGLRDAFPLAYDKACESAYERHYDI